MVPNAAASDQVFLVHSHDHYARDLCHWIPRQCIRSIYPNSKYKVQRFMREVEETQSPTPGFFKLLGGTVARQLGSSLGAA